VSPCGGLRHTDAVGVVSPDGNGNALTTGCVTPGMVENVLWPAYFDAELTRSDGRRLPTDQAVPEPTVDEIAQAVQQVGYDATIERGKAYSREYDPRGRVLAQGTTDTTKNDLVRAVGAYVAVVRGE